jgi:Plavaka transposase
MMEPEVTLCADGHFRRAIYGIGPYIGDYPEQVLLSCIVQGWCPRQVFLFFSFAFNK